MQEQVYWQARTIEAKNISICVCMWGVTRLCPSHLQQCACHEQGALFDRSLCAAARMCTACLAHECATDVYCILATCIGSSLLQCGPEML